MIIIIIIIISYIVEVKYNLDMRGKKNTCIVYLWGFMVFNIFFLFDFGVTYDLDNFHCSHKSLIYNGFS